MKRKKVTERELRYMVSKGVGLSNIDVSEVQDMSILFKDEDTFNQDISSWDVSNVKSMNWMFRDASAFNQDISPWDVHCLKYAFFMFEGASAFNQNLSSWDACHYWLEGAEILDIDMYRHMWSRPLDELPPYMNTVFAPIIRKRLACQK